MSQYLDRIYRACSAGAGGVIRAFEVVRSWSRENRRDRNRNPPRKLRRSKSPIAHPAAAATFSSPPPVPPPALIEPLLDRKRKSAGSPLPMSQPKRPDYGFSKSSSSPWSNESWAQHSSSTFHNRPEDARDTRNMRWRGKKAQRQRLRQPCFWNPNKYERSPSPPKDVDTKYRRIPFYHHRCPTIPGQFHQDIYYPGQLVLQEDLAPSLNRIDKNTLQTTDFTPLKPAERDYVPPVDDGAESEQIEKTEEDLECEWDEEEETNFQKILRSRPDSFDEDGYRLPIDGVTSPESRWWNKDHERNLHKEAAKVQQTPSRPPKHSVSSTANHVPFEEGTSSSLSPNVLLGSKIPSSGQGAPAGDEPDAELRAPKVELEAAESELQAKRAVLKTLREFGKGHPRDRHTESVSAAPVLEIGKLSLQHVEPERTPKAKTYLESKKEHKKRMSERLAALEAAKDAYPLVPLSRAWDAKVRYAVNHDVGRFTASMFSRCVPEYAIPMGRSSWLDDAVINDYIAMVAKHGRKDDISDKVPTVAALSSYFYTKISSRIPNYSSCARMVNKAGVAGKKLLLCEKIFIPINEHAHWTLAVIEPKMTTHSTTSGPRRMVTIYNSMGQSGGRENVYRIMNWIQHELGASFKEDEWDTNPVGESPQQANTNDCGVFTCTTARQIMLGRYQDVNHRYKETAIKDMRKRLVAELVNGALLNKDESASETVK